MADIQVEVWNYATQSFIAHIPCPGEKRVRVDYHGSLHDLAPFEVHRDGEQFFVINPQQPLEDWRVDYS